MSRTTFRFVVALPGLALLLVALRGWSVAHHQCDASGARLTGSHGSEVAAKERHERGTLCVLDGKPHP